MIFFGKKKNSYDEKYKEKCNDRVARPSEIDTIVFPEVEKYLKVKKSSFEENVKDHAVETASQSRPLENGDTLSSYIQYIADEISVWCSHILKEIQPAGLKKTKEYIEAFYIEEVEILTKGLTALESQIRNKRYDLSSVEKRDIYDWGMKPLWNVLAIGCFMAEIIFNISSLQAIGLTIFESSFITLPVTLGMLFCGYFLYLELVKDETTKKSIWNLLFAVFLFLGSFALMGYIRTYYLQKMNRTEFPILFGAMTFVVFNVFLFLALSVIFHRLWPTNEQRLIRERRKKIEDELATLEIQKEKLMERQPALRNWRAKQLQLIDKIIGKYNDTIGDNINYYKKIVSDWKRIVSTRLSYTPDCFKQKLPRITCKIIKNDDEGDFQTSNNQDDE